MGEPSVHDQKDPVGDGGAVRSPLPDEYLDLYKLAVEMADRVSARRNAANSFFLAVQTALVTLLGVDGIADDAIAVAGLVLAASWWLLLRSYRKLNGAKFAVIGDMERALPVEIFNQEWRELKGADPSAKRRWRERYAELGVLEQVVPAVFAAVYVIAILLS
jgi:hypothetical protein